VTEGVVRKDEKKSRPHVKSLRANMTEAEVMLWSRLRLKEKHGAHFRRQHPVGPYIADFACVAAKLIVEVGGATHSSDREIAYDQKRDAYMMQRGWHVMRVTNSDVYKNLDNVCEMILSYSHPLRPAMRSASPSTSPAPAGEEN
jgi:very-short-patch-repair endonuclease